MLSGGDHWKKIKQMIMNSWEHVTEEQLERTKGNISSISNIILKNHKVSKKDIAIRLVDIMHASITDEDTGGENDYQEHPTY